MNSAGNVKSGAEPHLKTARTGFSCKSCRQCRRIFKTSAFWQVVCEGCQR